MALEVMTCCGALTHVYGDTVRTHNPGCTGKVVGKGHTKPVSAQAERQPARTAKHVERRQSVRRAEDRITDTRVAQRRQKD